MAKFISVTVQNLLDSGTDATGTASKLTVAATATFSVGDYVYNTTDETYATITVIDSGTVVSISADIMDAGEAYAVYSATASTERLMAGESFLLAEQASPATNGIGITEVSYSKSADIGVIITHVPQAALITAMAVAVETEMKDIHRIGRRPDVAGLMTAPVAILDLTAF